MGLEVINRLKKEKGLTNAQISELSGVTLSTLDKITSGVNTNPKLDTLQAIANVLGCSLSDFDDRENEKQSAENGGLSKRELALIQSMQGLSPNERELALDLCSALVLELLRHHKVAAGTRAAVPAGSSH